MYVLMHKPLLGGPFLYLSVLYITAKSELHIYTPIRLELYTTQKFDTHFLIIVLTFYLCVERRYLSLGDSLVKIIHSLYRINM